MERAANREAGEATRVPRAQATSRATEGPRRTSQERDLEAEAEIATRGGLLLEVRPRVEVKSIDEKLDLHAGIVVR